MMPIEYVIDRLLLIYVYILWARIIFSWFAAGASGFLSDIIAVIYGITEPVLNPIRRIVPPVAMGAGYLDLAPLILLFTLNIVRRML